MGFSGRHQPADSALCRRRLSFIYLVPGRNGGPLVARRKYVARYASSRRRSNTERDQRAISGNQCYRQTRVSPFGRSTEVHGGSLAAPKEVALEKISGD